MIPYGKQSIDEEDIEAVVTALKNDLITTGPIVEKFESLLSTKVGAPTFVVNSGTAALHCAYYGIGIEPGDEVITPPNTFVATQATAINLGAKIVFADIDLATGLISTEEIAKKITHKTKAIVLVDYAGQPCDIDEVKKLIAGTGIKIIQDAAHSLGSMYKNQPVGSLADVTTFSFYPTKNITTGEGRAVSTQDGDIYTRAKEFGRQGLVRDPERFILAKDGPWHQEVHDFGLNYRLSDFQCALGISQLSKIENFKTKRQELFNRYHKSLSNFERIELLHFKKDTSPMWHLYPIRVPKEDRLNIYRKLLDNGIRVQINYIPAYFHPAFKRLGYEKGLCPTSEKFYEQEISLPLHTELTDTEQNLVIEVLADALS